MDDLSQILLDAKDVAPGYTGKDLLQNKDLDHLRDWLCGARSDPPPGMANIMGRVADKFVWALAFVVAQRLGALQEQAKFLERIERDLFQDADMDNLDSRSKERLYTKVHKMMLETMDSARKFMGQMKPELEKPVDAYAKLLDRLRALPADKVERAIVALELMQ